MRPPLVSQGLLISALVAEAQLCYKPDGTPEDFRYAPCLAGQTSMCCRTNDTLNPDQCRLDGLCQATWNGAYVYRESCTDREWKSPACLKLCISECTFFVCLYLLVSTTF